ncbi:MAG: hypothetical protein LBH66_01300 [Oscillospiraceae bacterium]|jgi:hypothetical protein|nr:hypothetical protein [Oscillospiraceae bacterium]
MEGYGDTIDILCDASLTCDGVEDAGGICVYDQVTTLIQSLSDRAARLGGALSAMGAIAREASGMITSADEAAALESALIHNGKGANALTQCTAGLACCLTRLMCGCDNIH